MVASLRALLDGIIDYAGLFPPARLPLEQVVRNYLSYRRSPESWMLARFVCPAARLAELGELLQDLGPSEAPVPVAVLARGGGDVREFLEGLRDDLEAMLAFRARHGARATLDVFEQRPPGELLAPDAPRDLRAAVHGPSAVLVEAGGAPLATFCEVPFTTDWFVRQGILLGALIEEPEQLGFKFRCGGVEPSAFPSVEDVAFAVTACRLVGVPLKFTAGLHHPIRRFDAGLQVMMHGFVNVFGAAMLGHACRLEQEQLRPILADEDAGNFVFDEAGFRWKDYRAGTEEIVAARQRVVSFGSCSFDEPRDDLRALGWL
jgi:hypothetical protein